MAKKSFLGIHVDLGDISMIGKLQKGSTGWFAPIVWRATGATINVRMTESREEFSLMLGDDATRENEQAHAAYDELVRDWKAS